jgi:hypothetical protein
MQSTVTNFDLLVLGVEAAVLLGVWLNTILNLRSYIISRRRARQEN